MSAPQQQSAQKAQRRNHKKPHHGGQHSRSVVSDNDAYTSFTENNAAAGEAKARPRRKSHANKKVYPQNDAAAYSDGSTQRPATHHGKTQATPIKQQAYAGPTFHQSPAPSALPLPSFYSKSLPTASPLKAGIEGVQNPGTKNLGDSNNDTAPPGPFETKRETTPLDFLFDAARKANATPGHESPNHRHYLSSAADTPMSKSPAVRDADADFPFELDAGDQSGLDDASITSTPYKERIEAARSQRTPSAGGKGLDEDERRAKTAALKQFLMNSAQSTTGNVDTNPFNARSIPPQPRQYQHRSSPNTPYNMPGTGHQQQYFPSMPPMPSIAQYHSPSRPGPSSNLRKVYQPGNEGASSVGFSSQAAEQPRISTAREQVVTRNNFADVYNATNKPREQESGHRSTPSVQQMEDDLRRILKLDLVSRG